MMRDTIKLAAGIFLGGVLLVGGCGLFYTAITNPLSDYDIPDRAADRERAGIAAYSDSFEVSVEPPRIHSGQTTAQGVVYNPADRDARRVSVTTDFLSADGTRLARRTASVHDVPAGGRVAFPVRAYVDGVDSIAVSDVTAFPRR